MAPLVMNTSSGSNGSPSRPRSAFDAAACASGMLILYAYQSGRRGTAHRRKASTYPSRAISWGSPAMKSQASGPAARRRASARSKKSATGASSSTSSSTCRETITRR
jgi:hypothetical protein